MLDTPTKQDFSYVKISECNPGANFCIELS
jgi:hypothetical protein